jgi:hypothetical protein
MSPQSAECRARAEECMMQALAARDQDLQYEFMGLASQWRKLADIIDRTKNHSHVGTF